jgi:hypothetical protein
MITQIEVRNSQGGLLPLTMASDNGGIVVKDIDGLYPTKATIVSSSFAMMDGTLYQSSRRENRNIVIKLDLDPDYIVDSVQDVRTYLYNFFMPKTAINLRFYTDSGLTVNIDAMVEDFNSPFFTQTPEATVSIVCFKPDFLAMAPDTVAGSTVSDNTEMSVFYEGTTASGFTFTINVNRPMSEFTIYSRTPDNTITSLDFQASLIAGDVVSISTVSGAKSITLTRSGVTSSLLYGMIPPSKWIQFVPGLNYVRVYSVGAAVPYTIAYTARYGGL